MPTLIQKAQKGNRDAMTQLYQNNKQRILYLCNVLLCDPTAADNACVQVFKNSWDYLLNGNISSEKEFTDFIVKKAVNHCKNKLTKKNSKAFRIPMSKNFAGTQYTTANVSVAGDACDQILASLPIIHRFIYVTNTLAEWSEDEIATLIHSNTETVRMALEAEETNISRILACISKKTGENAVLSVEKFHQLLLEGESSCIATNAVDTTVIFAIDSIAKPIEAKVKKKMTMTTIIAAVSCILVVSLVFGIVKIATSTGTPDDTDTTDTTNNTDDTTEDITWLTEVENPTHYAVIEIADYGTITVALDGNSAPETVENFITLAEEGFYDGLTFHRIIEGFMMQGGDPNGDGTGGNKDEDGNEINITGEFYDNGYDNYLSHVRGAISMARSNDYNSASSQFFIVHEDSTDSLDGLYAAFGYVIDGMDVVDAVCESAEPTDSNGTIESENQPVITTITIYTPEEYEQFLADSTPDAESAIGSTDEAVTE